MHKSEVATDSPSLLMELTPPSPQPCPLPASPGGTPSPALGPPSLLGVCEASAAASERNDLIPPVHPKSPSPHTDQPFAGPGWHAEMLAALRRTEPLQITALLQAR